MFRPAGCFVAALLLLASCGYAFAQQTTITSPLSRTSSGFSENIGVRWGFRFPGGSFQFGGPPPAAAAGGANFSTRIGSGDTGGYFNVYAGQSATTGFSGGSSGVTVGNGQSGGIFEGRQVPFVMGMVPVVGDFGGAAPPIPYAPRSAFQERVERLRAEGVDLTAPRRTSDAAPEVTAEPNEIVAPVQAGVIAPPSGSVEAIAASKAAADANQQAQAAAEIAALLAKAEAARTAGKPGLVKLYLQMAYRRSAGQQQAAIAQQLRALAP